MFLAMLQEKRKPLRQNIYRISPEIIDESTKRWLNRFKWISSQLPGFLHGGAEWKF